MVILEAALVCLALNVYHEARGEPIEGKFAVAQVTLNRAGRDQDKVCQVVYSPKQFSWTINPQPVKDPEAWKDAMQIARLSFYMQDFTNGADHFHAISVYPSWAKNMRIVGHKGNHIFYKRK